MAFSYRDDPENYITFFAIFRVVQLYEIIARRKPSDKFMEYAQRVGMFLLFALLIWANFNDIMRFLF